MNDRQMEANVQRAYVVLELSDGERVTAEIAGARALLRLSQDQDDMLAFDTPLAIRTMTSHALRVEVDGRMETVTFTRRAAGLFHDVPREFTRWG